MANSAEYAMKAFQEGMKDVSGTLPDDEISALVSDIRHGIEDSEKIPADLNVQKIDEGMDALWNSGAIDENTI